MPVLISAVSAQEAAPAPGEPAQPAETAPAADPAEPSPAAPNTSTPAGEATAPGPVEGVTAPANSQEALEIPDQRVNKATDLPGPAASPSRLKAARLSYEGSVVIAEGTTAEPVLFESGGATLRAQKIRIDTAAQTVSASGQVLLQRRRTILRRDLRPRTLEERTRQTEITESASGENLSYDFKAQKGQLDEASLSLAGFDFRANSLAINGRRYTAHHVVLRPGGLSEEERRIYGTPPFNLRARTVTAIAGETRAEDRIEVRGAGLFFKNLKILPVPSYIFRAGAVGGGGEEKRFQVTPRLGYNSADGVLLTTRLRYPLTKNMESLALTADVGLSQRVGFRGGGALESRSGIGTVSLLGRKNDVVTTQLTNRIELDRLPELTYVSPGLLDFSLPGGRRAGFRVSAGYGNFIERSLGGNTSIRSRRTEAGILFSTRLNSVDGPYLDLFASSARYSVSQDSLRNRGFEVGYDGPLLNRLRGKISYRSNSLSGQTPFRFDEVEIARELRATVDFALTPRYLIPVDLRYDLSRDTFRDKSFGLLRSYKSFAYGVVYQTARKDLRLEFRQGF